MRYYKRELYLKKIRPFYHDTEMIKVLTGIRRCGKSTILEMIKGELIDEGVSKEQIIDINLDKRGFKSINKADDLEKRIDSMSLSGGTHCTAARPRFPRRPAADSGAARLCQACARECACRRRHRGRRWRCRREA